MSDCPYCDPPAPEFGGWVHEDENWLVAHGPAATTMAGALRVTSRRHFTDFAEMTTAESESFGRLLTRLDAPHTTHCAAPPSSTHPSGVPPPIRRRPSTSSATTSPKARTAAR
ncbi:hypothetical protein SAMN04489729_2635 [Amycolatopsis lurida]|uniref:hypothetical protein n=1 Tax=Amycolatopsis lurida TaxID=31959 RepID=UPI0008993483|nr:hypothetical protein [Amycolatopsis lurida]SEC85387.1 hypothetical protein SAMN04489729_2635 [Amycolatopsis lurida]